MTRQGPQIGQAITSILFYGFGLLVAHRYSEIGLRVVRIISRFFLHTLYKKYLTQVDCDTVFNEIIIVIIFVTLRIKIRRKLIDFKLMRLNL
jgi:hypothetical protein